MKDGILQTVGKTISGVAVKQRDQPPRYQVYFVFPDNTYFELYGQHIHGVTYVRDGGIAEVRRYIKSGKIVLACSSEN